MSLPVGVEKYIVGNWKMHGTASLLDELVRPIQAHTQTLSPSVAVVLCPPATMVGMLVQEVSGSCIHVGGQDCHALEKGAYTGDISALMLKDAGASYVIVGHSERRNFHRETSADVAAKARTALSAALIPIICVGETLTERESGRTLEVIEQQIHESVPNEVKAQILIAYEPVWAIGTGRTATATDISTVHHFIRELLPAPLLYGGSVKAENAAEILSLAEVDGVLVGVASLQAKEFCDIIDAVTTRNG